MFAPGIFEGWATFTQLVAFAANTLTFGGVAHERAAGTFDGVPELLCHFVGGEPHISEHTLVHFSRAAFAGVAASAPVDPWWLALLGFVSNLS